jgi:hypothetical protein
MGYPVVFATGDGSTVNIGEYEIPKNSASQSVYLFIEFGSVPSPPPSVSPPPCAPDATGEEICGFDVTVEIQGDAYIGGFIPAPSVKFSPGTFDSTSRALHAVGLTAVGPSPGPQPIGELVVNTTGPIGGTIVVTGVAAVRADLEQFLINTQAVAATDLPEPNPILVLIAGTLTLRVLHSLRSRRNSFSPVYAGH